MDNKSKKHLKPIDLSGLKSVEESFKKLSKTTFNAPNLEEFVDPKTEMLANIEHSTNEMKNNAKSSFWKNLLIAVIGGIIGGAVPYFLAFFFE